MTSRGRMDQPCTGALFESQPESSHPLDVLVWSFAEYIAQTVDPMYAGFDRWAMAAHAADDVLVVNGPPPGANNPPPDDPVLARA